MCLLKQCNVFLEVYFMYLNGTNILQLLEKIDNGYRPTAEEIELMESLTRLDLSFTLITKLPESIQMLKNLQMLELNDTPITSLPEWIGKLPNLRNLNLSFLTLPCIPESLAKRKIPFVESDRFYRVEAGINIKGTVLTEQDKSIFLETPELIPTLYYKEDIPLNECRVLFLGDGGSGKTYTIRRIQNNCKKETEDTPYLTKETPGVEIGDYNAKKDGNDVCIHFWDFGGQAILHSMHRCFLSDKTCYVVTVRTRDTDNTPRARYWLRNVTAFAPNSPILLYVNCWEHNDGKRSIDESRLRRDFPNIKDVVYVSAKEANENDFRTLLLDSIIRIATNSEIFRKKVNRNWIAVRQAITEEGKYHHYITKEKYYQLCRNNNIPDEQAPALLTHFNILGVCFSYHLDSMRQEFLDYKLLTPVWLTNAIYAVIEEGVAYAQEGRITLVSIQQMLSNKAPSKVITFDETGKEQTSDYQRTMPEITYTKEECRYIIEVAEKRHLCYRINNVSLFFPALCTNNTPNEALCTSDDYHQHIEYLLHYEYLPDSVLHQLMVRCLTIDITLNHCWLRGMVLGSMGVHKAIVRMDDDENLRIEIWSKEDHPAYEIFELLRREIIFINERLNLKAKEFIVDGEDQYALISLLNSVRRNIDIIFGPSSGKERKVSRLLGLFYENWTLRFTQVKDGSIIIPILPRRFHSQNKSDPYFRRALYEAYNRTCPYCGQPIDSIRSMEVDHILPKKYVRIPELKPYIDYLQERGFDISKPDYVENYMPTHGHCNLDKSNYTNLFVLLARHERAEMKTRKILELYKRFTEEID